jgi:hypothetical protein
MNQRELLGQQYDNLKSMYVYCDIVYPQIMVSNELKLLIVIPFTSHGKDKHQAHLEPIRAHYLKLSKNISIPSIYTLCPRWGVLWGF